MEMLNGEWLVVHCFCCTASLCLSGWLLKRLSRLNDRTRLLLLARLLGHLAVADISNAAYKLMFTIVKATAEDYPESLHTWNVGISVITTSMDTCISLCTATMVCKGEDATRILWCSPFLAWISGLVFVCIRYFSVSTEVLIRTIYYILIGLISIGNYLSAIYRTRQQVARLAVVRRIAILYIVKYFVVEGLWIVRMCAEWAQATVLYSSDGRNVFFALFAFKGTFDTACYASSIRLVMWWLTSKMRRRTLNSASCHDANVLSEVLAIRLDVLVGTAEQSSIAGWSSRSSSLSFLGSSFDGSEGSCHVSGILHVSERRSQAAQADQDVMQMLQCSIDTKYVQEVRLQDFVEMLGLLSQAASEIEAEGDVEEALIRAREKVNQQKIWLEESVQNRLAARGPVSLHGGSTELWQVISKYHEESWSVITPLLDQLRHPSSVPAVKAKVTSMLMEQEKNLHSISDAKEADAFAHYEHSENLRSLHEQERAFTEVAMQAAQANAQSVTLQCVALQAISRTMKSGTAGGADWQGWPIQAWHEFAAARIGSPGCSTEAQLAAAATAMDPADLASSTSHGQLAA